ncbi:MAG: sulfotransferase family protein [Ignavibacteria bacterium]|nr:sulfotransferase family protein [Ignavibacteria bacterium]
MKIIGSGLGRTGTHSLKLALEHLGYGKCYHMVELFQRPQGLKYFKQAERNEQVNWDELFEGYASAVDYPVARYFKKLFKFYPDAKVIHTVRDSEIWYQSASETIFWASKPYSLRILKLAVHLPFSREARRRIPVLLYNRKLSELEFGKNLKDKKKVIERFNYHTKEVIASIPQEQLLVFNAEDGWKPLCEFLNVPVPSDPFPKSNTREEFINNVYTIGSGKFLNTNTSY